MTVSRSRLFLKIEHHGGVGKPRSGIPAGDPKRWPTHDQGGRSADRIGGGGGAKGRCPPGGDRRVEVAGVGVAVGAPEYQA